MARTKTPAVLAMTVVVALLAMLLGWLVAPAFRTASAPPPEPPEALPEPEPPLTFDQLAQLLGGGGEPAAAAFAAEFAAKPKLRRLWNSFVERSAQSRARQAPPPTAEEFLRDLRRESEFAALFSKHSGDPAFRALAEGVAKDRRLSPILRQAGGVPAPLPSAGGNAPPAGKVYGAFAVEGRERTQAEASQASATAARAGKTPSRESSDPRIEGHWVQDNGPLDLLAVCRRIGNQAMCSQALADCRKDPACARRLSAYQRTGGSGHGEVAGSTKPARGESRRPPRPEPEKRR